MDEMQAPPPVQMVQMLSGFQVSQALYVAAKLGVANQLLDGPRPVTEIAAAVDAKEQPLARLMRTLASMGVFTEVEPGVFGITPLGATLARDEPGSMADMAIMWMETHYLPFSRLLDTVTTETPAAEAYFEEPFFAWLSRQPEQVARFSRAMANLTEGIKAGALADLDVSHLNTLADVGGADGTLLSMVLRRTPSTRGVLFDLPHVVAAAPKKLADAGLADRVEVVGGDFFASVPVGADGYVLSMVLHDWSDDEALVILRNVAAAGGSGAQLVLVEFVLPPGDTPHIAKRIDLTMLGMLSGRERSESDWRALLDAAGFEAIQIIETPTPISRIHATVK